MTTENQPIVEIPITDPLTDHFSYLSVCYFCNEQTQVNSVQLCSTCVTILDKMHDAFHTNDHEQAIKSIEKILTAGDPDAVVVVHDNEIDVLPEEVTLVESTTAVDKREGGS